MRLSWAALAAFACVSSAGCAPSQFLREPVPLAEQADMFNRAAADAERMMVVRNIMRARDRSSMVFTRIAQMRGSMTRSFDSTIGLSIDEGGANDGLTAEGSLGGESNPSFDFQVMNDEKFNRAMHTTIDLGVYEVLQEYGWPPNLLHTLFIDRVEVDGRVYENDPEDWGAYEQFAAWLNGPTSAAAEQGAALAPYQLRVCHVDNPQNIGPLLSLGANTDLEDIAALAGQKLTLSAEGAQWRVSRSRVAHFFAAGACDSASQRFGIAHVEVAAAGGAGGAAANMSEGDLPAAAQTQQAPAPRPAAARPSAPAPAADTPPAGRIYVRSIQGVLYYLGEVVRAEHGNPEHVVRVRLPPRGGVEGATQRRGTPTPETGRPLFVVHRGACAGGMNFIHDDGARYALAPAATRQCTANASLADAEPSHTHQVVSLMLQLIGLIQSREDVPPTGAVQVVN
jgi:hypothetical protein